MGNNANKQDFNLCKDFVGLRNQGATCYLNTLLQTWFMTPEVRECIISVKSDAALLCELQNLFTNLESREKTSFGTNDLTTILRMNVYQQCDIEECFRKIINKLSIEMDQEHNILKFYQIIMVQSMKCSLCTSLVEVECPLLDLPLQIHSDYSSEKFEHLEVVLQEFLKEEAMEDDNACYCDNCNTKTKTETRYYFKQLPKILTFQLKRFEVDHYKKQYRKIHDYFTIPLGVEFNKSQDDSNEWILKSTMDKENNGQNKHCLENTDRGQEFVETQAVQDGSPVNCQGRNPEAAQDQSEQDSTEEEENNGQNKHCLENTDRGQEFVQTQAVQDGSPVNCKERKPEAAQDQSEQDSMEDEEYNAQSKQCSENIDRGQEFVQTQAVQDGSPVNCQGRKPEAAQDQSEQDSTEEEEKKYELFAVWHHTGGFGGGHYYAEIKSVTDGNWYCFNDSTVEQRGKQISLRSQTAYMIMYRRAETISISENGHFEDNFPGISQPKEAVASDAKSRFQVLSSTSCCDDFKNQPNVSTVSTILPEIWKQGL